MASERRKQYIAGGALILAVLAFILAVFTLVSRTEMEYLYLSDSQSQRHGWSYEVLLDGEVQPYEPVFEDTYIPSLPEGTRAVRISRTMTEAYPYAQLEWGCYMDGVEVFLDGELLYSDFTELARDEDGFVHPDAAQWARLERLQGGSWREVRLALPDDYLGMRLSMITYFPEDGPVNVPEYPFLGNEDADAAQAVVFSVRYNAVMTIYAIVALALAGMLLLDVHNSNADGKTVLLCLYFLSLFLYAAYCSDAGYFSGLSNHQSLLILQKTYMVPLYLYLALRMTRWWKWPLCGGIAAWAVYEAVREYLRLNQQLAGQADTVGPGALILFLAVAAAFCAENLPRDRRTPQSSRVLLRYGLITAAVTVLYLAGRVRVWGSLSSYLQGGIWSSVQMGNYGPLVTIITDITSYMTVIVVVSEVIRRTVDTRRTMDVLQERSRLTLDGYERTLRAEEATNAAKHEMRHHMTALAGLLQDGDTARAREYVASVADALDRLPTMRYSSNILVNAIAGTYLDQAKALGVRVECSLKIPAELAIADEDMSVFLTNMLENALHACQRLGPERDRYIRFKMALHENFLFISCANSAPDEQEEEKRNAEDWAHRKHGYGLEAMRQIAEKYHSLFLTEHTNGEYSVKSNFSLPRAVKTAASAGPRG